MSAARYIVIVVIAGLSVVAAALGAAVSADPAHLFRTPAAYAEIARLLHAGTPVGELDSPRHRLINRAFIDSLDQAPETVILGSSRVQPFSPAEAGWQRSLSLAVEGGDLGDLLYIYGLLRDRALIPARTVITVDPYIFAPDSHLLTRNGKHASLQRIVGLLETDCIEDFGSQIPLSWLAEVLTLDYVLESLGKLGEGSSDQVRFGPDPELRSPGFIKRPDGSVLFSREIRTRSAAYVDDYAATVLDHPVGRGLAFTSLDPCKTAVFQAFLDLLQHDGTTVILAMLPYHPTAFRLLESDRAVLAQVDGFVRQLAAQRSLAVLGAFDPGQSDCGQTDFLDMHHPKQPCIERILEPAVESGTRQSAAAGQ
ncbi:hypothetical protein [Pelagibius sp.]|uniref:hypothetical protein n=1 Tax=Pelagibius sp. TaxID=1931238 RepID=UPI0026343895|nr:hypothetical protein [Pelagibius sp.]